MPDATQWSGVVRPVQSGQAAMFGPSTCTTVRYASACDDTQGDSLAGRPRETLQLGQRNALEVERAFGALGEADHDEPQAVLPRVVVLFDQAAPLERRQES